MSVAEHDRIGQPKPNAQSAGVVIDDQALARVEKDAV